MRISTRGDRPDGGPALRLLRGAGRQLQQASLLGLAGMLSCAGVLLWLALHAPIGDRWKTHCAYALAGVWGAAQLGYRRVLAPVPARGRGR